MKNQREEIVFEGKLNVVNEVYTKRPNGTLRIQTDYTACPTLAEQHTAHLSDLNYLIQKYRPDELGAYIAARSARQQEIIGHDFSQEPNLQEARNITYQLRQNFEALPDEIKNNFRNHVEFLKFIDNPANQEKMLKLGLMTKKEIAANTTSEMTEAKLAERPEESESVKRSSDETKKKS